jgi:hypothetical protein
MPEKYQFNDLITIDQAAEEVGYTAPYMRALCRPEQPQYDPAFRKLRIETDPTWRKAYNSSARYVFRYGEVIRWFYDHQAQSTVQRYNESRGIIVE